MMIHGRSSLNLAGDKNQTKSFQIDGLNVSKFSPIKFFREYKKEKKKALEF